MKYVMTAALALCLIGGAAGAQDRDHERDHDRERGGRVEGRDGGPRGPGPDAHRDGPGPGFRGRGPEAGFHPGGFLREHGWRGGRFHAPFFRYPPGWGYRYWAFGSYLPGVFLGSSFTIGQYWVYGLPAPPPGYHWIRMGPDALLVRFGDGYVLDAAYGIFY